MSERFRRDFSLTPYTLAVGVAIVGQCHQRLRQLKASETASGSTAPVPAALELTKAQQRNAMFLFLRLINQADMGYQVQWPQFIIHLVLIIIDLESHIRIVSNIICKCLKHDAGVNCEIL